MEGAASLFIFFGYTFIMAIYFFLLTGEGLQEEEMGRNFVAWYQGGGEAGCEVNQPTNTFFSKILTFIRYAILNFQPRESSGF